MNVLSAPELGHYAPVPSALKDHTGQVLSACVISGAPSLRVLTGFLQPWHSEVFLQLDYTLAVFEK